MISRTWLALDLTPGALRAAALRGRSGTAAVSGGGSFPWTGVVVPSVREPNVLAPQLFVSAVREALLPLAARERRVALLLPDASGRVLLTETDLLPRSREEGLDFLRWHLKGKLPLDAREVRLDYQIIGNGNGGKKQILVSLASVRVLDQYEELLEQAGFGAALICFHSLGLFSYYRARIAGGDFVLVGVEGGVWSLQLFLGGSLVYHRSRELDPRPAVIYQETVRSLAGCRGRFSVLEQAPVCLHTDGQERQALAEALRGAFGREVVDAGPTLNSPGTPASLPGLGTASVLLAASIGAMERMMR